MPLWWKNSSVELSKCYQATHGQLTCIRCHSIHAAPQPQGKSAYYGARCLSCHKESDCKLSLASSERTQAADDCIVCHMEKRPVAGISHSNDTKHRIVRFAGQPLPDVAFEQPQPDLPGSAVAQSARARRRRSAAARHRTGSLLDRGAQRSGAGSVRAAKVV